MSDATANLHDESKKVVMFHDGWLQDHNDGKVDSLVKGGDLVPSNNGFFTTSNHELAAEMEQRYRGHVEVAPWRTTDKPQGRVMFTMPEMPWKKQKETPDENETMQHPAQP